MITVRVVLKNGGPLGDFQFLQVPHRDEHVQLPQGTFRVVDVVHGAGDPADGKPPAWAAIQVTPGV